MDWFMVILLVHADNLLHLFELSCLRNFETLCSMLFCILNLCHTYGTIYFRYLKSDWVIYIFTLDI